MMLRILLCVGALLALYYGIRWRARRNIRHSPTTEIQPPPQQIIVQQPPVPTHQPFQHQLQLAQQPLALPHREQYQRL